LLSLFIIEQTREEKMFAQENLSIATRGRGSYNVTEEVQEIVSASGLTTGLCHLFVAHTSASLMLCENADPTVRQDLETFMARLAPDGDPMFLHQDEGPDDMPAHVRTILTHSDLTLPVSKGRCALGIWQGIYLWEHRTQGHRRKLTVTINGN
jgi:secondary thiamine-phosphate synthase enzyme